MIDIWTRAVLVGAAASGALLLAFAASWLVGLVRRTPWLSLVVTLFFSSAAVMYGGAKSGGTNEMMRIENVKLRMENDGVVAVGDSTILHSPFYILHSTVTNAAYSYAMPSNAVRHEKWWRRGACFRKCKMENVERRMSA